MTTNPWIQPHIDAESDFQNGNRRLASQLVRQEFSLGPKPRACPHCQSTTYWKATIGAMKCPDCGGLAHSNGTPIGTP